MRKTMICEEVEIGNSWENVKKHAEKKMPNLEKIEFKPSQIDANGLKNRFGGLQDIILDSHHVSNTSKRLAP